MNWSLLALLGVLVGTQLNRGIYRLAWHARAIGPWSAPDPAAPPRHWYDRLPIIGWYFLRREVPLHGRAYWIRPMLIELACGVGLVGLVAWHLHGGLLPRELAGRPDPSLAVRLVSHAILMSLMLVATFIDIDEQTIPDEITRPGLLVGCALAICQPGSLLPVVRWDPATLVEPLWLTQPAAWDAYPWLDDWRGMLLGLACFSAWCFAICPRTWTLRLGWRKAISFLCASMARHEYGRRIGRMWGLGCLLVVCVWCWGETHWQGLLTALVGAACGGGLIWSVRVVASFALRQEAMGFGDVTLMAMIGAFVGWQSTLIIFFLAPLAGVLIAVAQWLLTRRHEIAYGPFICAGTAVLLIGWRHLWEFTEPIFYLGYLVPILVGMCLLLMAPLLVAVRWVLRPGGR